MKRLILTLAVALAAAVSVRAGEAAECSTENSFADWSFISLQFCPGVPSDAEKTPVCGVKVGVPIGTGSAPVAGVDCAVLYAGTETVYGLQACIIMNDSTRVSGLQFGIVNCCRNVDGVQLGIFNSAKEKSFQIGLLNHIEGALIPYCPIVNFKF